MNIINVLGISFKRSTYAVAYCFAIRHSSDHLHEGKKDEIEKWIHTHVRTVKFMVHFYLHCQLLDEALSTRSNRITNTHAFYEISRHWHAYSFQFLHMPFICTRTWNSPWPNALFIVIIVVSFPLYHFTLVTIYHESKGT